MRHSAAFEHEEYFKVAKFIAKHFKLPDDRLETLETWRCGSESVSHCAARSQDFADRLRRLAQWHKVWRE
jgi:hypothetical protein